MGPSALAALRTRDLAIRSSIFTVIQRAGAGHTGGSLSATEIFVVVLYCHLMRHDPPNSRWSERVRLILSTCQRGPVLYAVLADCG